MFENRLLRTRKRKFENFEETILRDTAYLCRAPRDRVVRSGRVPGVVEINVVGFLRRLYNRSFMPSVDSRLSLRLEPAEILLIEYRAIRKRVWILQVRDRPLR